MRNVYSCSIKICGSGFDELLESIFCLLLFVEAFSLQKIVEMLEEMVVNWPEVRWISGRVCLQGRRPCSIPGSERFPGEGNGNPLHYSCLGNPMDSGAWWATKSRTRLSHQQFQLSFSGPSYEESHSS